MKKRFASLWFPHLTTDWLTIRRPALQHLPFVFATPVYGRMVISAANSPAEAQGVAKGMVVADAKAFLPSLEVVDERPGLAGKLLKAIGYWCVRFTPVVAMDEPDGLIMDISGCAHLWGGECGYLKLIVTRLRERGYDTRMAIADTIGTAWAVARYGKVTPIIESGNQLESLMPLPPSALRLAEDTVERLHKLGLKTIGSFATMPRSALRRRFGDGLLLRLGQAVGYEEEFILPLKPIAPYEERLPCLEPISTDKGIEIALQKLLDALCKRLSGEGKGLREAILKCHRLDGRTEQISIGTSRATANVPHIFKLFALKVPQIEPALGIELFILEAAKVEDADPVQEAMWSRKTGLENTEVAELLDRLKSRDSSCEIVRYLPEEHYWPERSITAASSITEKPASNWQLDRPRPTRLLAVPEPITVAAPIPDYPPMLFRYKGEVYPIKKADGPERIEREWWMDEGEHRDYYAVEDDKGRRYWLYRSGHYGDDRLDKWFLHGFFA
ncbi:DNA polymerase Y family protein [Olivibacter sp. XZL3]|uniref:Y-family DNA polymerase n=1 Tax=Olivibacter sp. XZL3 TaxID=1735116 RepID=UPI0010655FC0|nr:DNA polymerase Y family protein [Olivibacter sp. XZL3]